MDGVDALLKLLTRVKTNGWSEAFAGVSGGENLQGVPIESYPPYSEPLFTLRQEMEQARFCLKALDDTRKRLRERLRALRKVSMPLVLEDGITRLPDDVLAVIFQIGHHMRTPQRAVFPPIHMSHVSRRFRRVALQTPSLWATIDNTFGESQTREFVSRSGRLDLEVKMHGILDCPDTETFLKVLKDTSHRWSSFGIPDQETYFLMIGLGITDLPRLQHLNYRYANDLSTIGMPMLSRLKAWGWVLYAKSGFQTQLTHVELDIWSDTVGIWELAIALHGMTNLKDLSLTLDECRVANESLPLDNIAFPKPRSVHIDRLAISILGEMRQYSALLFDALMHLKPSAFEMSINSETLDKFLFNSKLQLFPYSPVVKLYIPKGVDVIGVLLDLVRGCDIIRTVQFDTPIGGDLDNLQTRLLPDVDWERIRSLDYLRFINCDMFSEHALGSFATKFLRGQTESGSQRLEIISCKKISEDFLLGLEDEFGDGLKWTL